MAQPLIIKDWQNSIADSPNLGFGMLKNVSIDTVQGAVVPQYAPVAKGPTSSTSTFTADAPTDVCTISGGGAFTAMTTGVAVQFTTTGTLPAGLSLSTTYFLIATSSSTFKVATTYANSQTPTAIDITDAGTGTHTITTVNPGTFNSVADDIPNGITYFADSNGRVWYTTGGNMILLPGNTTSNASGLGLAFFINSDASGRFLFVFRNNDIDICDVTTQAKRQDPVGNSAWTNGWKTMNTSSGSSNSHHSIVGQDNIIYFCDDRWVGSIMENAGSVFAPGTAATYTFNSSALKLPQGELAWWLDELGINLLTAGKTYNYIYPWDRSSPSFGLPIVCAELGVYRIKNLNNTVYVLNGTRGNIYKTQGAIVTLARKLPEYLTGNGSSNVITWGGIGSKGGALLFGVACTQTTANSGVWALYPDNRLLIENQPSTGAANVTAINRSTGEFYRFGYAGGVDLIDTNRYATLGSAIVQSALYPIGNKTAKEGFSQLEVQLNQPGNSGSIRVSYRTALNASFAVLDTYILDGSTSFNTDIGLIDIENIQVQVELACAGSTGNALELMEVRLFP